MIEIVGTYRILEQPLGPCEPVQMFGCRRGLRPEPRWVRPAATLKSGFCAYATRTRIACSSAYSDTHVSFTNFNMGVKETTEYVFEHRVSKYVKAGYHRPVSETPF